MTIGQIVESLFGKICTSYGAFGDCTAFQVKGSNYSTYAPLLVKAGFNSSGNQLLYNGMTGEQLESDIYIGPTYYMRLKHMVKDKINYRARGPNTALTRQPVQGRANDGGLRIGEMERDGVLAHGMSYFLNESFLIRGDEYFMAVCNKTGLIAIYNEAKNLFISPYADGPLNFVTNPDGTMNVKCITKFGRSFSIVRVPYALKLLMQELLAMNIQMRIITEDNIDQLLSMSFSDNIGQLLNKKAETNEELKQALNQYTHDIRVKLSKEKIVQAVKLDTPELPEPTMISQTPDTLSPQYPDVSPAYQPNTSPENIPSQYPQDVSPAYEPNTPSQTLEQPVSQPYIPNETFTNVTIQPQPQNQNQPQSQVPVSDVPSTNSSILEVPPQMEETKSEENVTGENQSNSVSKQVSFQTPEETNTNNSSSSETRKISL